MPRSTHNVRMGPTGRVVIPATIRKALDLNEGSVLVATLEDDGR